MMSIILNLSGTLVKHRIWHAFSYTGLMEANMKDRIPPVPKETKADRLSRFIVAVVTCLGALGMAALLYFPLHYLK